MAIKLSNYDMWALRQWFGKDKVDTQHCSAWVATIIDHLDRKNDQHIETIGTLLTRNMGHIIRFELGDPPPIPIKEQAPTVIIPALPDYAQIRKSSQEQAKSAGKWLDEYMTWARSRASMTPPLFLLSGGIWLIGLATARRAYIQFGNKLFPHLYIFWVATTTRYAKSTGLEAVKAIAMECFPHLLLPSNSTPEALFSNLAGEPPPNMEQLNERNRNRIRQGLKFAGQRGMLIDEASKLLNAQAKDYMAGMLEMLLEGYDAPELLEKRLAKGQLVVERVGLSILGATTPAALSRFMNYTRWETGEMARYILLAPEKPEAFNTDSTEAAMPESLLNRLKALYNRLPEPPDDSANGSQPTAIAATIEPFVIDQMNYYRRAMYELSEQVPDALQGNYGRMTAQAAKVALSLALIDWAGQAEGNPLVIREGHWARAVEIIEEWRASLHRTYQDVTRSKEERLQDEIAHQLRRSPFPMTVRELQRIISGSRAKDIQDALNLLIESGMVKDKANDRRIEYVWDLQG